MPLIIAHRGASGRAPENTLAAVNLAWDLTADAVEVDVHLTSDKRVVVIHDARTKRTTGTDLRVAQTTLAELQALDAGSWKGAIWAGEQIPSLRETLATVPRGKHLVIELKARPAIVEPLAEDIELALGEENGLAAAQIVLIAFDREVAIRAKARLPELSVLWIGDPRRRGLRLRPSAAVRRMAKQARELGLDGLDLFAHRCVNQRLVEEIHALGLLVYVWTVNRTRACERLLRAGVDGITTNHPDVMLRVRDGAQKK